MRLENSFILVDGVGTKTERRLWRSGIDHWDRYDSNALSGTRGRRVEGFIETARPHLDDDNLGFFAERLPTGALWRCYENVADGALCLDIETTGLDPARDVVTMVTFHTDESTRTLIRNDDLTEETLQAAMDGAPLLVSFNGKRFDIPFLQRNFDIDVRAPHLDLMYPCRQLDLIGGLKAIETTLGIERVGTELSGRDAVRLWRAHERGRDGALETLVEYNRADTVNLRTVADIVTDRLHDDVFGTVIGDRRDSGQ